MQSHSGSPGDQAERLAVAANMAGALKHRGPDDQGTWDDDTGVTLGFRRLSIIDTSAEGHQPMASTSGRYVIVFNGEVYNFAELRRELESLGSKFHGHSDTEVMLAAFEAWGVERAVKRFVGMFAIGLWDRQQRELKLIRDRLGIKPLYYGWVKGTFLFGSELKALRTFPGFDNAINRAALCLYLRHDYIPAPYSIYRDINKLLPGRILTVPFGAHGPQDCRTEVYWSARAAFEAASRTRFESEEEALGALERTVREAVAHRMISDVPLGAFLSGGIDSSTVVALMQAQSAQPIKTFSIGFREAAYDEAAYARAVAAHLGTDHTELYVTPREAMDVIPLLPAMFDEPFGDSSQIPTYMVSKLARTAVTVSLSGDGGDELFAGYDRYFNARKIWRQFSRLPAPARSFVASALQRLPLALLWPAAAALSLPVHTRLSPDRLRKVGSLLESASELELYRELLAHWRDPAAIVHGAQVPDYFLADLNNWNVSPEPIESMCFADLNTYLPDDILTKVDRASMAVSLEARVPLLDHRVVELAWRVPLHMKVRGGHGKWLLRQLLYKYVPRALIERPKMGFGVPIDTWLQGPLRDWAEALLSEERLKSEGFFDPAPIRSKWQEHLSGKRRWHFPLWNVLMFQAWLERERRCSRPAAADENSIP